MDKVNLTQFGRAMKQLGIEMIPPIHRRPAGGWNGRLRRTKAGCRKNWL